MTSSCLSDVCMFSCKPRANEWVRPRKIPLNEEYRMKLKRMAPVGLVVLALFCPAIATATIIQIEEQGFIVSYTEAGFLTGSGVILGEVPAYGNDAGFLFVAEYTPAQISLPSTLSLILGGVGILAALGRRRRDSPDG